MDAWKKMWEEAVKEYNATEEDDSLRDAIDELFTYFDLEADYGIFEEASVQGGGMVGGDFLTSDGRTAIWEINSEYETLIDLLLEYYEEDPKGFSTERAAGIVEEALANYFELNAVQDEDD